MPEPKPIGNNVCHCPMLPLQELDTWVHAPDKVIVTMTSVYPVYQLVADSTKSQNVLSTESETLRSLRKKEVNCEQ